VLGRKVICGALFFTLLLLACAFVRSARYRAETGDYQARVQAQESFLRNYAHYRRLSAVARPVIPPAGMEPLVETVVKDRDLLAEESFEESPLGDFYPRFDFLFLIATVGSLLALLMSHDAITSEREGGTLPLLASLAVSRWQILLGKWLGALASLAFYLLVALLAAAAVVAASSHVAWGGLEWGSLALLYLAAWLYLAVFASLGLMISVLSRSSSSAALGCLVGWVALALVVPNLGPSVANTLLAPPPVYMVEKEIDRLLGPEREEALAQARAAHAKEGLSEAEAWRHGRMEGINRGFFDRAQALKDQLTARVERQTRISRNVSCLAPYACFLFAGTELAGAGISRQQNLARLLGIWRTQAEAYIDAKLERMGSSRRDFGYDDWIDVSDGPRFRYSEPAIGMRLEFAAPFVALLGGFLSLFTLIALLAFARSRIV
jgi:ABC-type transport system involved in multi-copper enzyme maturation permease subunit